MTEEHPERTHILEILSKPTTLEKAIERTEEWLALVGPLSHEQLLSLIRKDYKYRGSELVVLTLPNEKPMILLLEDRDWGNWYKNHKRG